MIVSLPYSHYHCHDYELRLSNQKFMGIAKILAIAILSALSITIITYQPSSARSNANFYCDADKNGVPTTYINLSDGLRKPMIRWVYNISPDITREKRCEQVSQRFQRSYDNGTLKTIISGKLGRFPVICATVNTYDSCDGNNLLFTLKFNDKPREVIARLLDPDAVEKGTILNQSSDTSRVSIDFDTYLNHLKPER